MSTQSVIVVRTEGPITTVTLGRPERHNAITMAMHHALQAAFDAFAADPQQRICVVTGAGSRAFSAGSDLGDPEARAGTYPRNGYAGLAERFDLNKPVIAAVNGICLGGGFELALACDIIVAADNAVFGLPEPLVGAIAIGGGVHRLVRHIGHKRAMGYLLTGAHIPASEALALGLINELTPATELMDATRRWCDRILACAPLAIRATKETALRGLDEPSLAQAMKAQSQYPAFHEWRESDEPIEGPRAFIEKRPPGWRAQ